MGHPVYHAILSASTNTKTLPVYDLSFDSTIVKFQLEVAERIRKDFGENCGEDSREYSIDEKEVPLFI